MAMTEPEELLTEADDTDEEFKDSVRGLVLFCYFALILRSCDAA